VGDGFELHRARRATFDTGVDDYDAGRPPYPARVYKFLEDLGALHHGSRVLEIGPGTGQATADLLARAHTVTAVELGAGLAHRLRTKLPDPALTVTVGAFEVTELQQASFDLIAAATSFHWVPEGSVTRCADLLNRSGWLAVWWTVFGDASRPDPFHDALLPVLAELAPEVLDADGAGKPTIRLPHALDTPARIAEIEGSGRFGAVHQEQIRWTGHHDRAQLRALFGSFSPWLALPPDRRARVLDAMDALARDEFGGVVERPYVTAVFAARAEG
jgi:SAM-dependent methyltransferase